MRCLTGVDHVSRQTCLGQERGFGGYELCGARALIGRLLLLYIEGLMLDPMCDTPHVQVTIVALQRSSKVTESVDSIPMRSAQSSAVLNTQASVSPRRRTTHSLKVIVYEWLKKTTTMQFVYVLFIASKRGEY